jgi:hypothetical protein
MLTIGLTVTLLVSDLGTRRFPVREQCSRELAQIGRVVDIRPYLQPAMRSQDLEVVRRTEELLRLWAPARPQPLAAPQLPRVAVSRPACD